MNQPVRFNPLFIFGTLAAITLLSVVLGQSKPTLAATDVTVYADSLASGWADWSWDTTRNFNNPTPTKTGTASISARYDQAWAGLYLHTDAALTASDYTSVRFWIHGGSSGGQQIQFRVIDNSNGNWSNGFAITPTANAWTQITATLSSLGNPATIAGLVWQEASGSAKPTFYLDDIVIVASNAPPPTPGAGPALNVDVNADRHAISPYIYGINFADESLAAELALPVRRWGGNATTRFNWQFDTSNRASDWYFENIPNANSNPSQLPNGSETDLFVEQDRRTNTQSILTMPLIGWTPKSREYACGFSVAKYGAQQSVDPWRPDCGNGVNTSGNRITGNDPLDTSIAITPAFVQSWMQHLISRYGTAANGGVRFYALDNEPMLWNDTHRDVHPTPTSYDEMKQRTEAYAAAIKATDPGAQTLGPVLWGWTAYFYSALDAAPGGAWWNNPLDRLAHGNTPFVEWYLQQMRAYAQQHGTRILDYLDLHFYPQGTGVFSDNLGSTATQSLRLRSTRALWDATYVDESWINQPVYLIPRMRAWVNTHYPGTKTAITEYSWGARGYLNGALAQADVLGIFGRENLDLATLWDPPASNQPVAFAFRMYRNYDGAGKKFGETSVRATSANQDQVAIYAAQRNSDNALTIILVNKTSTIATSTLTLANFTPQTIAQVYRYSADNLNAIARQPDLSVSHSFGVTLPASSITLLVIAPSSGGAHYDLYLPHIKR